MNFLTKPLPETLTIEGKEYPIKTDFRVWLEFDRLLSSKLPETEKLFEMIALVMDKERCAKLPPNCWVLMAEIFKFYATDFYKQSEKKAESDNTSSAPIFNFEYDGEYVYAAFYEQYGIDLIDIPYLHWWKFQALFKGLSEESRIMKIIGYRDVDINEIKDKNMKKMYQKLKDAYALPDTRTGKEKEDAFNDALSMLF